VDPKLFFSDPDPTFQEISDPDPAPDPDPTQLLSKEVKAKKNLSTSLNVKEDKCKAYL